MKRIRLLVYILFTYSAIHAGEITYYNQIQHILVRNCMPCHQKGGVAPFALETYAEVNAHIGTIKRVIATGVMPPWSADPNYKHFANERLLSNEEVKTILTWIDQKHPAGTLQMDTVMQPKLQLGKPDLVLKLPKVKIPAHNRDTIVHFKVAYSITNDTTAYAIRYIPGNAQMVHHANPILYNAGGSGYFEELDNSMYVKEVTNIDGTITSERFYDSKMNFFADYTPGRSLQLMPQGFSFNVSKDGFMLCQVHYGPSPKAFEDESTVEIYFDTKKAQRVGEARKLGSGGNIAEVYPRLVIPADSIKTYYIDFTVPLDASLIIYSGHMHLLGKKFLAYALATNNDTIPLLRINNYDFYLQDDCVPLNPVVLKRGYKIHCEATYDNTSNNHLNPNSPTQTVYEGWKTTDEMMAFAMYIVKYLPGDENLDLRIKAIRP